MKFFIFKKRRFRGDKEKRCFRFRIGTRNAFTVAELLVAVGLFVSIITIAIGAYLRMLQQQRLMTGLMAANDNVSLALEQIMREVRMGKDFIYSGEGKNLDSLSFTNDRECKITYSLYESSIKRIQEGDLLCAAKEGVLTSENVKINKLKFDISKESGAGVLAGSDFELISITVKVSNKEAAGVEKENEIKTKVSARKYFGG